MHQYSLYRDLRKRREKGPEKIFEDIIAENSPTLGKKTAFCRLKKDVQLESCELSYIWGKMRTAAWEAASQIALRDCSKAAVGEGQYIRFW